MILGPIGQKLVCAAGVERSTLHRCGLTRARSQRAFLSFINRALVGHFSGPGSISLSIYIYLYIFRLYIIIIDINKKIRCLLTGCSSLSTLLRTYRFAYLTYER
uniref:hypothetical protein n=1 Tax=Jatropha curcas TaxID=180498 RepID=UPI00279FDAE5|nr:hypothetical protein QLP06_mgp095 [Jatropha curcas]WFG81144.1 hypothetical protein [Jatropha curcas]